MRLQLFILSFCINLFLTQMAWLEESTSIIFSPAGEKVNDVTGIDLSDIFTLGFSKSVFGNINIKDALAATNLISNKLVAETGLDIYSETSVFNSVETVVKSLKTKRLDAIVLLPEELLRTRKLIDIDPFVVASRGGGVYDEYILLVNNSCNIETINDLEQKSFIISDVSEGAAPFMWLELLLHKNGHKNAEEFFSSIKVVETPSRAILPVFFKQADACLLSKRAFETIAELNPQIGKTLTQLAISPPIVNGLICIRHTFTSEEDHRHVLEKTLLTLQDDDKGKQILRIFQILSLVPFKEEYLNDVKKLVQEYKEISSSYAKN